MRLSFATQAAAQTFADRVHDIKPKESALTQERLMELLRYEHETGNFYWRTTGKGRKNICEPAGALDGDGYRRIHITSGIYSCHRLAWLWMTGEWPTHDLDHINGVRDDNRWDNIREATSALNAQNRRRAAKTSSTGYLGVVPYENRFQAQIKVNGKTTHLGSYKTAQEAHGVYVNAKRLLHVGNTL